jgi:hypothetical protein
MFDPLKITYEELLNVFWRQIDPADLINRLSPKFFPLVNFTQQKNTIRITTKRIPYGTNSIVTTLAVINIWKKHGAKRRKNR